MSEHFAIDPTAIAGPSKPAAKPLTEWEQLCLIRPSFYSGPDPAEKTSAAKMRDPQPTSSTTTEAKS